MIGTILTKISGTEDVTMVTLNNLLSDMKLLGEILNAFHNEGVNLDMICQSAPYGGRVNVSFTIEDNDLLRALKIAGMFKSNLPDLRIDVNSSNAKLNFFGEKMKDNTGVAAYIIGLFLKNNVMLKLITTSDCEISCLLAKDDFDKICEIINSDYNLDVNIY